MVQSQCIQQVKLETDEERDAAEKTAKEEPTSRPAGQSDRRDRKVDVGSQQRRKSVAKRSE
jgi:hypothetical protein